MQTKATFGSEYFIFCLQKLLVAFRLTCRCTTWQGTCPSEPTAIQVGMCSRKSQQHTFSLQVLKQSQLVQQPLLVNTRTCPGSCDAGAPRKDISLGIQGDLRCLLYQEIKDYILLAHLELDLQSESCHCCRKGHGKKVLLPLSTSALSSR